MHKYLLMVSLLTVVSIGASARSALALFPGDCGKPTTAGTLEKDTRPVATDALAVLRGAVDINPCANVICDVFNNGSVDATDALLVLRVVVGLSPLTDLNCPTSCAVGDGCICPSSATDLYALLDKDHPTNPTFDKPAVGVAALLHCDTPTTISVDGGDPNSGWLKSQGPISLPRYVIEASNLWFHGNSTITIKLDPACNHADCSGDDGIPFLHLKGDGLGVTGLTISDFDEGVHFRGKDGTVANMVLDHQCDDSITNESSAVGSQVRDSVIRRGCDKCAQDEAGPPINTGTCVGRRCYHNAYYDVDFEGCSTPWRLANTAINGRFLMSRGTHKPTKVSGTNWSCSGLIVGVAGLDVTMDDVTVDGCHAGGFLATART